MLDPIDLTSHMISYKPEVSAPEIRNGSHVLGQTYCMVPELGMARAIVGVGKATSTTSKGDDN